MATFQKILEKIIYFLPALIKGFKFGVIMWEAARLNKTDKSNKVKHEELKIFINKQLDVVKLDITDKQVDAIISLIVKYIK